MKLHYEAAEKLLTNLDEATKNGLNRTMKVLCISENWCSDCGNGVPIITQMAKVFDQWDFKISSRDQFEKEIEMFYTTAGRKKIPIIIFADEDGDEVNRWVERPARSYRLVSELKNRKLNKEDYMATYKSMPELKPPSLTQEIIRELLEIAGKSAYMLDILPKKTT